MTSPHLILMDDVHLEGRPEEVKSAFAQKVKNHITLIKASGNTPIVICAGDIGEGVEGIKWASQFMCDIIYICGNHEFWGQDYFSVIENIRNYAKNFPNIHFLYNETKILHGLRFIGGTLWTSLGSFLPVLDKNYAIRFYGAMGDFKRIKATHWYNTKNEKRLKNYLKKHGIDEEKSQDIINNQLFNPLLELEENQKTTQYFIEQLNEPFNGKTIVVSHHLPCYESWMKRVGLKEKYLTGEWVNNEKFFYESAKGNNEFEKDVLMMCFYANDLKDLMYGSQAPDIWVHGHLHQEINDVMGKTQIISSPVGYQKQAKEMVFKDILLKDRKKFIGNCVKKEIMNYEWNAQLLSNLHQLEQIIIQFEIIINTKTMSSNDFEPILNNFKQIHEYNLQKLKESVKTWLSPFMYDKHQDIIEHNVDEFLVKNMSGFDKKYPNIKFPEVLAAGINENSFLNERDFQIANKGGLRFYHYREWLKELQRIQIQIGLYKKSLLDFCDNYSEKLPPAEDK